MFTEAHWVIGALAVVVTLLFVMVAAATRSKSEPWPGLRKTSSTEATNPREREQAPSLPSKEDQDEHDPAFA